MFVNYKFYRLLMIFFLLWKCIRVVRTEDDIETRGKVRIVSSMGFYNIAQKTCDPIMGKQLKRVCRGQYPLTVHQRYSDSYVSSKEPYTVFRTDSNEYFFSFGSSKLNDCNEITIESPKEIICNNSIKKFPYGHIECIDFYFTMSQDLLVWCVAFRNATNFSAYHYTDISRLLFKSTGNRIAEFPQTFLQIKFPRSLLIIYVIILLYQMFYY